MIIYFIYNCIYRIIIYCYLDIYPYKGCTPPAVACSSCQQEAAAADSNNVEKGTQAICPIHGIISSH